MNVPHLSIDIVFDGKDFHLIEFQAVYFGTSTYNLSDTYFKLENNIWKTIKNIEPIEKIYADSIINHIEKNNL